MKVFRTILAAATLALSLVAHAEAVDVNTADAATISKSLKGIGMAKAEAIVEYRSKHGPFKNADELSLVKGIGERTVEINRTDIKVGPAEK